MKNTTMQRMFVTLLLLLLVIPCTSFTSDVLENISEETVNSVSENNNTVEILISNVEIKEIFDNPEQSYVCLNKQISHINDVITKISEIDEDETSFVHALKNHMDLGYVIGRYDAVVGVLNIAQEKLQQNRSKLADIEADAIENTLNLVIDQVTKGYLSINAEKIAFLKDSFLNDFASNENTTPESAE